MMVTNITAAREALPKISQDNTCKICAPNKKLQEFASVSINED